MNKRILFIALVAFQSWSLVWAASYRLQLKNGNEVKTPHYWEEGDEIKFYVYGGIAGIQKGFVHSVTISKSNFKEDAIYGEGREQGKGSLDLNGPKSSEGIKMQNKGNEDKSEEKPGNVEVVDIQYYSERKATLKEKLSEALEKNREATNRKDQEAKKATRQEMRKYAQQLHDLEDELKEKNKGSLPDWWKE
jgi:hypothetical protein